MWTQTINDGMLCHGSVLVQNVLLTESGLFLASVRALSDPEIYDGTAGRLVLSSLRLRP